jgi:hypothetical protein
MRAGGVIWQGSHQNKEKTLFGAVDVSLIKMGKNTA